MDLWSDSILTDAAREPALAPPATPGELFEAGMELRSQTGMSISALNSLYRETGKYYDQIHEVTGERLPNPYSFGPRERSKIEKRNYDKIRALAEDHDIEVLTLDDIRKRIGEQRAEIRERTGAVQARSHGFWSGAAGLAGEAVPIMFDPPVLASMFFGGTMAQGILRFATAEAIAAGAGEAVAQAVIQSSRRQFGEEPDPGEAALAVGTAAMGGFVLGGLLRAAGRVSRPVARSLVDRWRAVRGEARVPERVRDAEAFLERQAEIEEMNPFEDTPAGRAEHAERFDAALRAAQRGERAPDMPSPRSPLREGLGPPEGSTAPPERPPEGRPAPPPEPPERMVQQFDDPEFTARVDAAQEAELRDTLEPETPVYIERPDGTVERVSFAEVERMTAREQQELEVLEVCLGGVR